MNLILLIFQNAIEYLRLQIGIRQTDSRYIVMVTINYAKHSIVISNEFAMK